MKPYARPVGYIRVSHEDEGDNARSLDEQQAGQIASVQALAKRNGFDGDLFIYIDWDRSADPAKEHRRVAFNDMLAAVARGEVSAIYARSLDRLYRSMVTFSRLADAAKKYGVRIEVEREGVLGGDGSPMAQAFAQMTAIFTELELNTAKARAQSRVSRQKAAGYQFGPRPYGELPGEDAQKVVQAFKDAGGYSGAVRLLHERGIPSRRSHLTTDQGVPMGWSPRTVRSILLRVAPELVPMNPGKGSRTVAAHLFTRLLLCPHDGSLMTTIPRKNATTAYVCRLGHRAAKGTHPRPWVISERRVRDWAKAETAGVLGVGHHIQDDGVVVDLDALEERRRRFGKVYAMGAMSDAEFETAIAEIDAEVTRLQGAQRASLTFRLGLDWNLPIAEINTRLRELWAGVRLGYVPSVKGTSRMPRGPFPRDHDLVPVGAIWRVQPVSDEVWATYANGEEGWESVPDKMAERTRDGWYLPSGQGWNA